jgi:GNAT superfamily N-acetyltransferase
VKTCFRQIDPSEVNDAYDVYVEVFEWLRTKGVRQWLSALPVDCFLERASKGQLYAYCLEERIAAVATLCLEASPYWAEFTSESRWWIKTLAVARKWRGAGVGALTIRSCETQVWNSGASEVFLDCVDCGFLPGYYAGSGYALLARKDITYPSGNTFAVALMRKSRHNYSP